MRDRFTSLRWLCAAAVWLAAWHATAQETNPARTAPRAAETGRLIVTFRESTNDEPTQRGVAQTQSVEAGTQSIDDRITALAARVGLRVAQARALGGGMHVLDVEPAYPGEPAAERLARVRADSAVASAELDRRRYIHAVPNDPLYTGQWYWQSPSIGGNASATDAESAWDLTTGNDGVVIAVIDTGVLFDHPDLKRIADGGRLLPGYDFIRDVDVANDGNGMDADATDPGDWITQADKSKSVFSDCDVAGSSWHGTRVAGIIGARTNAASPEGIAGGTWKPWILPVRALGKCFGTDSDIMSAMLWAGGIHVNGVPDNPYPAKVENLSIGAEGTCGAAYQNVIAQLAARGVLVVVSAGNEGGPVDSPANCPGVVGVAGLRHAGTKVGYSSLGPEITVGAPAGNCINSNGVCLRPINTTSNGGSQAAAAYTYTDATNANLGTSFSAPIVSAIAGLMVSANGNLTTTQLIERLKEGASKPFPASADSTVPVCHVPNGDGDIQNGECNCTTDTCGAGMANARGAVTAALRPMAAVTTSFANNMFALSAENSSAAPGAAVAAYLWEIACGSATLVGSASGATTSVAPPTDGAATVRLTVTDDAGRIDVVNVALTATTASQVAAGAEACPVTVQISPSTAAVTPGGTVTFIATVSNTTNKAVTWQVDGVPGGSGTSGTITADGLFMAPATVATQALVTVKAVWSGDPARTATASVTLQATATPSSSSGGGGGGGGGATDAALLALLAIGAALRRRAARNSS